MAIYHGAGGLIGDFRPLTALLMDDDPEVRQAVAVALVKLHPEAKVAAIQVLNDLLKDKNWWVRKTTAEALGNIGPDAESAVPALTKSLQDADDNVRKAAAEALKKIRK
jgi:HEAT repeat protein